MGFFQRKKTNELKLIPSASPYRLNNLETRINVFAENSICAVLERLGRKPAPIWKFLCVHTNGVQKRLSNLYKAWVSKFVEPVNLEYLQWRNSRIFGKLLPQYHNLPSLKHGVIYYYNSMLKAITIFLYFDSQFVNPASLSIFKSLVRGHKGYLFSVELEMTVLNSKTTFFY